MQPTEQEAPLFNMRDATNYWRFAPSGLGKMDSSALMQLDDKAFLEEWQRCFDSRLGHYWEERRLIPFFAKMFSGKRVLSFGSGLGLNEIQFVRAGAQLTCADIVASNMAVIDRVARLEGRSLANRILITENGETDFGGPYDFIYANGSLMTMPFPQQRKTMGRMFSALAPGGLIILNLYTRKFAEDTQAVDSPRAFALRSDPSVGEIHNPWSDWHDDSKLQDLIGPTNVITHKQLWNQDYYIWYGVMRAEDAPSGEPKIFLDLGADGLRQEPAIDVDLTSLELLEAQRFDTKTGVGVATTVNNFFYAAWSPPIAARLHQGLELLVDVDLHDGPISVALLDVERDTMIISRAIVQNGRALHLFPIPQRPSPDRFRFVVSNFAEGEPRSSRFTLFRLALVQANTVGGTLAPSADATPPDGPFWSHLRHEYSDVFDSCWRATQDIRGLLPGGNYEPLARRSPGLAGYQWDDYIRLGVLRMVRVARALGQHVAPSSPVLDLGSYFGNFTLMAHGLGYRVDAMDTYRSYAPAFENERALLESRGIRIIDSTDNPRILAEQAGRYSAVMCLGVIEHIPHTPKELLAAIRNALAPGGILILDTPNLAYLYRREALMKGLSVYPPIEQQFHSPIPFEGHHREYTRSEVRWMLEQSGFELLEEDLFNFSTAEQMPTTAEDIQRHREMEQDPEKREVIFAVARRRPG